jgi:hypothetical protein
MTNRLYITEGWFTLYIKIPVITVGIVHREILRFEEFVMNV